MGKIKPVDRINQKSEYSDKPFQVEILEQLLCQISDAINKSNKFYLEFWFTDSVLTLHNFELETKPAVN